ncbi:hypothetical protein [Vreelandella sulfidaeris]
MTTTVKNPLPDTDTPSHVDLNHPQGCIIGPDLYYVLSEWPLHKHVDDEKRFLYEHYHEALIYGQNAVSDPSKIDDLDLFHEQLHYCIQQLKSGLNAMRCEEHLRTTLSPVFRSEGYREWFPVATTWIICAELLVDSGLSEKAWSALLSFKDAKHHLLQQERKELELQVRKRTQAAGSEKNKAMLPLRNHFVDLLAKEAPEKGWISQKVAAAKLASDVHNYYLTSGLKSVFPLTQDETEIKLISWLKNNQECRDVFFANKKQ